MYSAGNSLKSKRYTEEERFLSDFDIKEKRFEQGIEKYLITEGGYEKGDSRKFDCKLALDTESFLKFLKISQPKQWERYEKIYGTDSEKQVVERFCREVKMVGLLHVLRQGFTDRGVKFRAVFWKPETPIHTTTQEQANTILSLKKMERKYFYWRVHLKVEK